MKKINILILTAFVLFFLTACQSSAEQAEDNLLKPIIKIAYLPITHSIPILVQQELEKSLDLPYKIELVKFTTWPELVDALRQNKVDGASILFEVALKAAESSDALKLVSLSHRGGNVIVSNKDADSFKDLKGKTVAIPHKLSPHNTLLHELLEKEQMTIDDIKVVELAPADMPSSLISESISAFVVAEPYGSISAASDTGKILYTSQDITEHSACCAMVFHNGFLSENPELMSIFFDSFLEAAAAADKKDDSVVKVYGKAMSLLKHDVIKLSLETISFNNLTISKVEYEQLANQAIKYGILESAPDYDDFIYRP